MVNMFVLANGSLSSPWNNVATYDGRYVMFTSSTAQHGGTGGADRHRHVSDATSSGNGITSIGVFINEDPTGSTYPCMGNHSHNIASVDSGYSDNDPLYYTLSLWSIDYSTWLESHRNFPANVVVLSTATLSVTGMSRFSAADGRLIKLGTPGSSGGRSTHDDHTLNITLDNTTPTSGSSIEIGSGASKNENHGHTGSASSVTSNTIMPATMATRFYLVTSETDLAPQNVVCFFDGTPDSNWTVITSWNGYFAKCDDSDPTTSGSNVHGHSATSINSSNYNSTAIISGSDSSSLTTPHYHIAAITLQSADHTPQYVTLCPYYLNTTLYHVNTSTTTYTMDHILRVTKSSGVEMDLWAQSADTRIMTQNVRIRNTITDDYDMDMIGLLKDEEVTYDLNVLAMIQPWSAWKMAVTIMFSHCSYESGMRLVRPVTANPPVIDTIVKALADEFNTIQKTVKSMEWANKLPSATGSELDKNWGDVYEIPRWKDETDDAYRKRLQTYTLIHTSSGAKANAEAVLDAIIDEDGATSVDTFWPATVRVNFATDSALRKATTYQELLEYTLGQLIAAGISWTIYLPYIDYELGAKFRGQTFIEYDTDLLVKMQDMVFNYWLRPRLITRKTRGWDMDIVMALAGLTKSWSDMVVLKSIFEESFVDDVLVRDTFTTSWTTSIRALRVYTRTVSLGARVMSYDLEDGWDMDARLKRVLRRSYHALTTLILQLTASANMDAWLKKFNVNELYEIGLNIWVCEPEEYGMTYGAIDPWRSTLTFGRPAHSQYVVVV